MKIRRAWKIRRATLTKTVICAMIESASPWSGIEVVITALTRNRGRYSVAPCPESLDFTGFFGYSQLNIFACSPHQFSPFSEVLMLR